MKLIGVLILLFSGHTFAGYLVQGGTITKVMNTEDSVDRFQIRVEGGTPNLCQGINIKFDSSKVANAATHARSYSSALTALTTGMKVSIYNYNGSDCNGAAYIELSK